MKTFLTFIALMIPVVSVADRISDMSKTEECVYRARLAVAGSYIRIEHIASSCEEIKIHWHGDETPQESEYVKYWSCIGFKLNLDPIKTGDKIYESCTKEVES